MSGREHDGATLLLASVGAYALWRLDPFLALGFAGGSLLGGLWLSPDLDLPDSRPSRRWGPLRLLWEPYRAFHPHRGRSHTYLYGPLSRFLYLGLLLAPLALVDLPLGLPSLPPEGLWGLGMGYLLSQWLHLLMDGILPFPLRRKRRRF
ncbi:DUF2227 family putative metal-binding protein [Thermus sp.]|uniref:DUF2227 family putative metal-binding protein n=1 Tax=Thermus sp. TaxID=275 RepID=UPI0025D9437E|nr:DUF2227 family putative metal-binding protein [Thermus sp.]MCS6869514.1 DUF2227 family putative metal-binding protein [Thermus sp.]